MLDHLGYIQALDKLRREAMMRQAEQYRLARLAARPRSARYKEALAQAGRLLVALASRLPARYGQTADQSESASPLLTGRNARCC